MPNSWRRRLLNYFAEGGSKSSGLISPIKSMIIGISMDDNKKRIPKTIKNKSNLATSEIPLELLILAIT